MNNENNFDWHNFLNPDLVKTNLILASLFIAVFETFKDNIIDRGKSFYTHGFDDQGPIVSDDYKLKVMSKNKSPIYATLMWLNEIGAITESDIGTFTNFKNYRNNLVHNFHLIHSQGLPNDFINQFQNMTELLHKIEKWWFINIEAVISEISTENIDIETILSGQQIGLRILIDLILGNEEESNFYFNKFKERK
jgi:hypothetical protein